MLPRSLPTLWLRLREFASAQLRLELAAPLALALPPLFLVVKATRRASFAALGRDQGIFQYVAWAITRGALDYRDIRDVNGPLAHVVHLAFLMLGGADEHRFRVLDLAVTGSTFALVGACLHRLGSPARPLSPFPPLPRLAWALAAWVVLSGQYLLYIFWDIAQRESFYDWFMLPSVALQLAAQAPARTPGAARADRTSPAPPGRGRCAKAGLLTLVGALSVIPWFGKPTYALFTLAQLAALVSDAGMALTRRRAIAAFAAGGAGAAAALLGFTACRGDLLAYARIQFVDVPAMYRFIWPRSVPQILALPWISAPALWAGAGSTLFLILIALGKMPKRALVIALVPVCALGGIVLQAKGFPYHAHPLTAGVRLQWLALVAWLTERTHAQVGWRGSPTHAGPERGRSRLALREAAAPIAVSAAIAFCVARDMRGSPHIQARWLDEQWSDAQRKTPEYFAHYALPDFFPFEMRQAAAYLSAHTRPDDRVQIYGMDSYVLFLAARLSATPYIYAYDLNADAALAGGSGIRPDRMEAARIQSIRSAHEADLLSRLSANPPAAFVFFDRAPLLSETDAWHDFQVHCPRAAAWVSARYDEAQRFGHDRIWLRRDAAER